jgi:hypothetical protein
LSSTSPRLISGKQPVKNDIFTGSKGDNYYLKTLKSKPEKQVSLSRWKLLNLCASSNLSLGRYTEDICSVMLREFSKTAATLQSKN